MDLQLTPTLLATPHRAVLHRPTRTIIIADLHLGVEAALRSAGTLMPDFSLPPIRAAWQKLLARRPARIIIAGDLFHTPAPDDASFRAAEELLANARNASILVTLIPGNHDPAPAVLRDLLPASEITDATQLGEWHVRHGHEPAFPTGARGVIVGHQHPAVILANRVESAKMICFATVAPAAGSPALVVLPAFSPAPLGSNLLTPRNWMLPGGAPDPARVRIAGIVNHRVLDFGPLSQITGPQRPDPPSPAPPPPPTR